MTTILRGHAVCSCLAAWVPLFDQVLAARGVTPQATIIQGGYRAGATAASAGTHDAGGVLDIAQADPTTIRTAREMGAAAWARTSAQGFTPHAHLVLIDCPHNSPARYQVRAYKLGRNGLGWQGLKGADDGPRITPRTWTQGIAWAKNLLGDDMPITDADAAKIAAAVWKSPVRRNGKTIEAIQELADTKTLIGALGGLAGIARAVWRSPVTRDNARIEAIQELADTKTEIRALRAEITELMKGLQS